MGEVKRRSKTPSELRSASRFAITQAGFAAGGKEKGIRFGERMPFYIFIWTNGLHSAIPETP